MYCKTLLFFLLCNWVQQVAGSNPGPVISKIENWLPLLPNLNKIQLFIILSFYYRMKIWQRPIGGHVQTISVISISGNFTNQSKYSIQATFWAFHFLNLVSCDWLVNSKGHLHMTHYGSLSDLHTILERYYNEELYFNQISCFPSWHSAFKE